MLCSKCVVNEHHQMLAVSAGSRCQSGAAAGSSDRINTLDHHHFSGSVADPRSPLVACTLRSGSAAVLLRRPSTPTGCSLSAALVSAVLRLITKQQEVFYPPKDQNKSLKLCHL